MSLCNVAAAPFNVIPWPNQVETRAGHFTLSSQTTITADRIFENESALLANEFKLNVAPLAAANQITLTTNGAAGLAEEAYRLEISNEGVVIRANTTAGIYYGVQTLRQLWDVKSHQFPLATIEDSPRYSWRGLMLDVSRHFFDKATVLHVLDWMAEYKLNRFHLHLTDDPAWRMEVGKYPELAQAGARGNFSDSNAPARYFTKQDLREIVRYAAQRHIVVIPEIDMPGHAGAATRTYPAVDGGENTFNPVSDAAYEFLENVLLEAMDLFPSPWIHFGGDEVKAKSWKNNPAITNHLAAAGLNNSRQLEGYFARRISKMIAGHGRIPAGWDEIATAGAGGDALIYWWRHDKPEILVQALAAGNQVVLAPRAPLYFDYPQDKSFQSLWAWKLWNTSEQVYRGPKIPTNIPPAQLNQILGVEGCVWTERIATVPYLEFMLMPRMVALAEMAWTKDSQRDYISFSNRLKPHLEQYRQKGIQFYDAANPVDLRLTQTGLGQLQVTNPIQGVSAR